MPSTFQCCVHNCEGGKKNYSFPPLHVEKWCENLQIDTVQYRKTFRICELHFEDVVIGQQRLKKCAMPTKMLGHNSDPVHFNEVEENAPLLSSQRKCCVINCEGGVKKFPFSLDKKKEWCENLKLDPSQVNDTYRICELHFDDVAVGVRRIIKGAVPTKMLGHNSGPVHFNEIGKSTNELRLEKEVHILKQKIKMLETPCGKCEDFTHLIKKWEKEFHEQLTEVNILKKNNEILQTDCERNPHFLNMQKNCAMKVEDLHSKVNILKDEIKVLETENECLKRKNIELTRQNEELYKNSIHPSTDASKEAILYATSNVNKKIKHESGRSRGGSGGRSKTRSRSKEAKA